MHSATPRIIRQAVRRGQPPDRARFIRCDGSRKSRWVDARCLDACARYSPITDQMKPIMMKKPVNRAISPKRGLRVLAPDVFARLGRFAVRRRWAIVVVWAAILLVAIPAAPQVVGKLRAGGFILDDLESARAKALLQKELGAPPSAVVVVLHSDAAEAGTPAFEQPAA